MPIDSPEVSATLSLPHELGPYRLEKILGRGGMGEVYQAYDQRLGRRVAIKRLRGDRVASPQDRSRLRREARAAAQLSHPAIIQIFDVLESYGKEGGDWIVMERVVGPSLAQLLHQGPLEISAVLHLGRQVAEGLAEAHHRAVVHRDLKGENVLLTAAGQAKILDFGLAKGFEGSASVSIPGQILGTCRAMSPEQARGLPVDFRSDLFSLGVLLYEAATGISPFAADTALDTLQRIGSHLPPPIHQVKDDLPLELSQLVAALLEKAPEARPASASQVAESLLDLEQRHGGEAEAKRALRAAVAPGMESDDGAGGVPTDGHSLHQVLEQETLLPSEVQPSLSDEASTAPRRWKTPAVLLTLMVLAGLGLWLGSQHTPDAPQNVDDAPTEEVPDGPEATLRHGFELLEQPRRPGNAQAAVKSFQRSIDQDPERAAAYAGLARALWWTHRTGHRDPVFLNQAEAAADQAVALDPWLAEGLVARALVATARGQLEQAETTLRSALELDPSAASAWWALGNVLRRSGDFDGAMEAHRRALEEAPDQAPFWDDYGALLAQRGRYSEAEAALQHSLELAPESVYALRNLATIYYLDGRLDEAAAAIQQALRLKSDPTLYSSLGTLLFSQGLYPRSAEAFEKAVEGNANSYLYWANLADAYRHVPGRTDDARRAYAQALQLMAEESPADAADGTRASRRLLYLAKKGECPAALEAASELAAAPSLDATGRYRLAVAQEVCNRRDDALAELARALDAGFSTAEARRDPELLELRRDPRFHRMTAEVLDSPTP